MNNFCITSGEPGDIQKPIQVPIGWNEKIRTNYNVLRNLRYEDSSRREGRSNKLYFG